MLQTAQIINTAIFLALSGLHFYWAYGALFGKKMEGAAAVLPETEGKPLFIPGPFATFVVAMGLLFFAEISSFGLIDFLSCKYFSPIIPYGNLAISIIFLVRAIGDFRYVGFFKKTKTTKFAINDTKYYSPLCGIISVLAFILFYYLTDGLKLHN
jgi:hypothetical protein